MSRQERGRRSVVRRDESSARRSASIVVIASLAIGAPANRAAHLAFAAIPVPTSLEPGDKYHLAFVSTLVTPAISADIATYNSVAQDAANSAGVGASEGVTWTAIASTALVNARDNAPIGAETPVYNMIGQRVADGFADMWDGQIDATLARDQFGNPSNVDAWTGSTLDGFSDPSFYLGNMSSFAAWRGRPSLLDAQWINLARPNLSAFLSVYALSAELMVPPSADFDENGVVDGHDLIVWQRGFGATPAGFADGDANGDDIVDHNDLAFWESHFGEAADVVVFAATPAPEPSTWLLTASAYMAVLVIRRRRGS